MGGSVVMDPQAAEPVKQTVETLGELLALGTDSEATVAQTWLPTLRCSRGRSWQHSGAWASTTCVVVSTVAGNPCPVLPPIPSAIPLHCVEHAADVRGSSWLS